MAQNRNQYFCQENYLVIWNWYCIVKNRCTPQGYTEIFPTLRKNTTLWTIHVLMSVISKFYQNSLLREQGNKAKPIFLI